jgi:uncharacterized protein (UPF0335 family)
LDRQYRLSESFTLGSSEHGEQCAHRAKLENLQILKAEVLTDHKGVMKAFKSKGFDLKCILDEFFLRKDGMTHDVALLIRPVVRREESEF